MDGKNLDVYRGEQEPENLVREFRKITIPENPDEDFSRARENVYEVMTRNADALEELISIAAQAPHPRTFEVISQLVKTGLESSVTLLEIQQKNQDLKKSRGDIAIPVEGSTTFTSSDLLDVIKAR